MMGQRSPNLQQMSTELHSPACSPDLRVVARSGRLRSEKQEAALETRDVCALRASLV